MSRAVLRGWPARWCRAFQAPRCQCQRRLQSRPLSSLRPQPAAAAPTSSLTFPSASPSPATVAHYDIPAADFPPQHLLRTLDNLPPLPPAASSPSSPYLYQTLPPLPLLALPRPLPPLHPRTLHPPSISLALSGGVDSSVALFLLLEAGYAVHPLYMHTWDVQEEAGGDACPSSVHLADARAVCRRLGVELEVVEMVKEYWVGVFEGMVDGYRRGVTPNPDVACNREVKFGRLMEWVRERRGEGAMLATGHYARTQRVYAGQGDGGQGELREGRDIPYVGTDMRKTLQDTLAYLDSLKPRATVRSLHSTFSPSTSPLIPTPPFTADTPPPSPLSPSIQPSPLLTTRLLTALDSRKDQTYFLSHISPSTLPSLLFPLGSLLKPFTRILARHANLPTSTKPDSMGICMIGPRTLPSFLSHYLHLTPGRFVTPSGTSLGPHLGQEVYTTGQGAKVGGQQRRLYVAAKLEGGDVVVVDDRLHPMLLHDEVVIGEVQWMEGEPRAVDTEGGGQLWARFRSTEALRRVTVQRVKGGGSRAEYRVVCVDVPHHLISPGQVVAFYLGEHCLGGGPILRAGPSYHALNKRLHFRT